jgi:hypothetical protein
VKVRGKKTAFTQFYSHNLANPRQPFTDEAQTALFKDPVRTAL